MNGRVLVPLRQISEALGYSVQWEPKGQIITLHLRPEGQTSRGIRLGDSIEKVLEKYPRGISYPKNFSGDLYYEDWIPYQCGSYAMVFEFKNGILVDVYACN